MNVKEVVAEIVKRYNSGDRVGARKLFMLSKWKLPEKTKDYFYDKFKINVEITGFAKEACDIMGGKIIDDFGNTLYEGKKVIN